MPMFIHFNSDLPMKLLIKKKKNDLSMKFVTVSLWHSYMHTFFSSNHFQHVKELMTLDMIQYIIWKRQYRLTTTIIAITG